MEVLLQLASKGVLDINTIMFLGSGLVGMFIHYMKKRVKGETKVTFAQYFGKNNPLSSTMTLITYAGTMMGMLMGTDIAQMDQSVLIVLGTSIGYSINSAVNTVKEASTV